jgi:D-xylulose kinase
MGDSVLAIDTGTTGVRSIVFDITGEVIVSSYEEFSSQFPQPSWVEQDANVWWKSVKETIHQCLKAPAIKPDDILGISITNQRETIVPVNEDGAPLRNAIVWQDRRTTEECDRIKTAIGIDTVYTTTGLTIDPYFSAPKILWIQKHDPAVFKNTYKFLLVHDFILHHLTDRFVTDYSNASRTMLFDVSHHDWSEELLSKMEIPPEKMPEPHPSGTHVGELSNRASHDLGLPTGISVITGGGDQQCAALGVGVTKSGLIKATTGTGTFILAHSDDIKLDSDHRVLCSCHVVPNSYVVEASIFTTGSALRWFRDNLGYKETTEAEKLGVDPYELLTEGASEVPAGSEGILHIPHFVGAGAPYWNPHARGIFAGLALGHTRKHLIRAILEGVAYEIRTNLDVMRELGMSSSEVRVTGGASRSRLWMQIQSDVFNLPVILTQIEEATALGAAILACKGAGVFSSITKAADEMVRPVDRLTPSSTNREVYDTGYLRYKALYAAISNMRWD